MTPSNDQRFHAAAPLATASTSQHPSTLRQHEDDALSFKITFRKRGGNDCGTVLDDDSTHAIEVLQRHMATWFRSRIAPDANFDIDVDVLQSANQHLPCLVPVVEELVNKTFNLSNRAERLDSEFVVKPSQYFSFGVVFEVVLTTAAGPNPDLRLPCFTRARFGEVVQQKVRKMVVVKPGLSSCLALPITEYVDRGAGRLTKSDYGIIFTGEQPPDAYPSEFPEHNEKGMQPVPIQVASDRPTNILQSLSRLDYSSPCDVSHMARVKPFGVVHPDSMDALASQTRDVWSSNLTIKPPRQPRTSHLDGSPCVLDKEQLDKIAYYTQVAIAHHRARPGSSSAVRDRQRLGKIPEDTSPQRGGSQIVPRNYDIKHPRLQQQNHHLLHRRHHQQSQSSKAYM